MRDLFNVMCVNKQHYIVSKQVFDEKFNEEQQQPFDRLREETYTFMMKNIKYLTLSDQATIYQLYTNHVFQRYRLLLCKRKDIMDQILELMNVFDRYRSA
jgi:hypothetical protein